jgi:hypothetical protein
MLNSPASGTQRHPGNSCALVNKIERKEKKMTSIIDLSADAPAATSVFHPEHPLHHLVLDLAEQVDQAFEQWLAKVAPGNTAED